MNRLPNYTAKLRVVQVVLRWAWDPIGVRGIAEAAEEYHNYAVPVLDLLERSAEASELESYLTWVEQEWMRLPPDRSKNQDVARMLLELHRGD